MIPVVLRLGSVAGYVEVAEVLVWVVEGVLLIVERALEAWLEARDELRMLFG